MKVSDGFTIHDSRFTISEGRNHRDFSNRRDTEVSEGWGYPNTVQRCEAFESSIVNREFRRVYAGE